MRSVLMHTNSIAAFLISKLYRRFLVIELYFSLNTSDYGCAVIFQVLEPTTRHGVTVAA